MSTSSKAFQSIQWLDNKLVIIDQSELPQREIYLQIETKEEVWDAINKLRVRGAPAIGIAGAYGFYLGIRNTSEDDIQNFHEKCHAVSNYLNSSRPTAVNLSWALKRLMNLVDNYKSKDISNLKAEILKEVILIHNEDRDLCRTIGEKGEILFGESAQVLTHCNTGGLATGQYGTALSCITHAYASGRLEKVWVDETRPLLQGARLTTWELRKAGVPHTLIIDSAAGYLMSKGEIDLVIVGADRITKNGDTANKIGTYTLSVLAKEHGIPFYVAAPFSTFDFDLDNGSQIEIELRNEEEITSFSGNRMTPEDTVVYNPAFDVTPHQNITAIITEKGVVYPDFEENIRKLFSVRTEKV